MTEDPSATVSGQASDADLLEEYRLHRSDGAFAQIVNRHGPLVLGACRRVLRDEHEADDAAQATFLVLAERSEAVDEGRLAGWLYGVAVRIAWRHARSRQRRRRHESMIASDIETSPGGDADEDSEQVRREMDAALARLPATLREAVVLRYLEGRSQREAAELAGCPVGTMASRAAKGLERLRELLGRGAVGHLAALAPIAVNLPAGSNGLAALHVLKAPIAARAATLAKGGLAKSAAAKAAAWGIAALIVTAVAVPVILHGARRPAEAPGGASVAPIAAVVTANDDDPSFRDFTPPATIVSIADGAWSSAATWSLGRVPRAGDAVAIARGTAVVYDLAADARLASVVVRGGGVLRFRTDADTRLVAADLLIQDGGRMSVGTAADPVREGARADLVIADDALDPARDPERFGDGLVVLGALSMHGAQRAPFARLAAEPRGGDRSLSLEAAPAGWRVGDRLGIPDTRQLEREEHESYRPQWEDATIAGISADGRSVALTAPLAFTHPAARDPDGRLDFLPHAVDQTRNVEVRSLSAAGTRGHVWATRRAQLDLRYAAFVGLGRSGAGDSVGSGQARYPLCCCRLDGSASTGSDGQRFVLIGNVVDGLTSDANGPRGGIVLDRSHFGLVRDNVVLDVAGFGIAAVAGCERGNLIEGNFVARVHGDGAFHRGADPGQGSGYWLRGPDNALRGNVAADIDGGAYACGFSIDCRDAPPGAAPAAPGAEATMNVEANGLPLRECARNEAYGALGTGFFVAQLGMDFLAPKVEAGRISDCRVWHQYCWAFNGGETNHLVIERFTVRGDPANRERLSRGLFFGDCRQRDFELVDADIQGEECGVQVPSLVDGPVRISGGILRDGTDLFVETMNCTNGGDVLQPRRTIVRDVTFAAMRPGEALLIEMGFAAGDTIGACNLIQDDRLLVYGFDRVAGDDFRVYFREQAPDFIVPASGSTPLGPMVGAPAAGLSNAENWRRHRIAIAGSVSPTSATRAGIAGLVGPIPPGER